MTFGGDRRHEIVGVVADARYRDVERPRTRPSTCRSIRTTSAGRSSRSSSWTDGDAAALAPVFREAMREADPNQPISRVRTFDEMLATALAPRRFNTLLVGVFALTALLLAAVGTFGVMAFSVASRTRELGVRAALGATPADLRRMVLGQGVWLSAVAVVMGLAAAWLGTRGMASLLYGVQPDDPLTFALVAATLAAVALLATWIPARGATRVDPIAALREQ